MDCSGYDILFSYITSCAMTYKCCSTGDRNRNQGRQTTPKNKENTLTKAREVNACLLYTYSRTTSDFKYILMSNTCKDFRSLGVDPINRKYGL